MSEQQQKPKSFMQELDQWSAANVIGVLEQATEQMGLPDHDPQCYEQACERVQKAIREKVLESYRNGQQAGPRSAKQPQKGGRR